MKVTPTWLLTSAAQVIITIAIGAFMIINAAVIGFYCLDAYENYSKRQSIDVTMVGRIHKFHSRENVTSQYTTTQRYCTAVVANGKSSMKEMGGWDGSAPPRGDFCKNLLSHSNLNLWESYAPKMNGTSSGEKFIWSVLFFIVFVTGAYLVTSIPANVIGIIVPGLAPFAKILAFVFTTPVILFWIAFVMHGWSYYPSYWVSPDGYTVETQKVFITSDNRMYNAPDDLFDWSSGDTMDEVTAF